ncbi:TadE family type IV pilus minor pilin [Streptomyces sp. CMB-StM0423]|uniref:TadE family type IV pilus minor pilin n=1 Tax=Streptomyces sp. CMB-StM0423 TaxID=2059884 RepID=UPI001F1D9355|nr:TadE family type IV pilus minor pilin [Streptomyces sp. CMB-StM0423]
MRSAVRCRRWWNARWTSRSDPGRAGARTDAGVVTAEAAVAVPALVFLALGLVWALMAAAAQIQCVDAARAGARAAARGEPPDDVRGAALAAAPRGADVAVARAGDLVRVRVRAAAPGPGSLSLDLGGEAVALVEETVR